MKEGKIELPVYDIEVSPDRISMILAPTTDTDRENAKGLLGRGWAEGLNANEIVSTERKTAYTVSVRGDVKATYNDDDRNEVKIGSKFPCLFISDDGKLFNAINCQKTPKPWWQFW